jgi:hypothetical protein
MLANAAAVRLARHGGRPGFKVEVMAVEYEFQRAADHAGNRMLRARRNVGGDP